MKNETEFDLEDALTGKRQVMYNSVKVVKIVDLRNTFQQSLYPILAVINNGETRWFSERGKPRQGTIPLTFAPRRMYVIVYEENNTPGKSHLSSIHYDYNSALRSLNDNFGWAKQAKIHELTLSGPTNPL